MKCTKCGAEIKHGENFCMHCGEKAPSPEHQSQIPNILQESPVLPESGIGQDTSLPQETIAPQEPGILQQPSVTQDDSITQESDAIQEPVQPKPKKDYGKLKLRLLQALFGVGLAVFMFFFASFQNSIKIMTSGVETFNDSNFSLLHVIGSLVNGTERYNPSVLSIVMGVGVFTFIFAASAFWLFSAAATLIGKGEKGMRRMSVILTFLALASACALPHLAYMFVTQFKYAYARTVGVLSQDMSGVSPIFLYIWAGIAILLVIATWIVASKRNKAEGTVIENEK